MNCLLHEVDVLLVDREDVGEVACDPGDVDQGEDNSGNLAEKKMKEIRKHGFQFQKILFTSSSLSAQGMRLSSLLRN